MALKLNQIDPHGARQSIKETENEPKGTPKVNAKESETRQSAASISMCPLRGEMSTRECLPDCSSVCLILAMFATLRIMSNLLKMVCMAGESAFWVLAGLLWRLIRVLCTSEC